MFNFVAVIFLVVNGVPAGKPSSVLKHEQSFKTEAGCMAFIHTEAGKAAAKAAVSAVEGKPLLVRFGCMEAEDNSI